MTGAAEHEDLLKALIAHDGPVILSGYDSELYNDMLGGGGAVTASTPGHRATP